MEGEEEEEEEEEEGGKEEKKGRARKEGMRQKTDERERVGGSFGLFRFAFRSFLSLSLRY